MLTQARLIRAAAIFCGIQILCLIKVESLSESDRIQILPGQPQVSFQQFGGYITVDEKQDRALFYYFVEAETDPASKPLVLWLNGGPGCSSIGAGAFCEHGPFKPSGQNLVKNDYSWNKEANMLYLESPAGVGFSYSANKSYYARVDDDMTARDNLVFLENWFNKFPDYKNRDFFITGESYGGHYVPQLAQQIIQSKLQFNLKGIAIGNPLLEFNTDFNSTGEYYWSHGLISDDTYQLFNDVCNYSQIRRQAQNDALTPVCSGVFNQASGEISKFIDGYDQETQKVDVCVEDETFSYLNREDVQKAFHARLVGITQWSVCSERGLSYFYGYNILTCIVPFEFDAFNHFHSLDDSVLHYDMQNLEIPTVPVLGSLVKSGIRVLVYSGDQDSVIPLTGTRRLVNGLARELGLNTTVPYRVWFEGSQVAGWTQVYGDILSFATIRGASHEAPFSQPERSLVLFNTFLGGKPLPGGVSSG
ncbi:hypothetical protein RHMOL_Rhmol03G0043500 [Rhododendron molle]|uniref:Uncharacterized protein n=1 Tax=Rhododendron molle TaxID=49168 RepID=A0ACC0PA53_RHOML|nr:hypothetical protein RHMOL_Rhmol03G0043500 [Rhododendron molle]